MATNKPVVLVVDDDQDVLDTVEAMLADEPYQVRACRSAQEAERAIEKIAPDFMIIDLMMEEIDAGVDLVSRMRQKGIVAPAYMLSSLGDELDRTIDFTTLGLAGVMQKPVDKASLLALLRARLHDTPARR